LGGSINVRGRYFRDLSMKPVLPWLVEVDRVKTVRLPKNRDFISAGRMWGKTVQILAGCGLLCSSVYIFYVIFYWYKLYI
jgi:hypothetical protein